MLQTSCYKQKWIRIRKQNLFLIRGFQVNPVLGLMFHSSALSTQKRIESETCPNPLRSSGQTDATFGVGLVTVITVQSSLIKFRL